MADAQSALEMLRRTDATPIAQLCPDIEDASSRAVDGVVTITWPHSVVTKSVAFILSEHDFRLRRDNGQLRVELHGAAAEALARSPIAGGDELRISLSGVEWEKYQAPTRLPVGTLAWQLRFSRRLMVEVRRAQDQGCDLINVDVPEFQESQPEPNGSLADGPTLDAQSPRDYAMPLATSPVATPSSSLPAKRPASSTYEPEEFASPAFLKRARVSYGSLYEGGLDIFREEQDTKAKGKRQPRFSMQNTKWRYTSRSPSPEADRPSDDNSGVADKSGRNEEAPSFADTTKTSPPPLPSMVDEACQTQEVYFSPSPMEPQAFTESHVAGFTWQPASASGPLGAQQQGHHVGFQTPSRTLFDRRHGQPDLVRTAEEPGVAVETAASPGPDTGIGAGLQATPANVLDAPPLAASVTGTAAFGDSIPASDYPLAPFGANHTDAPALNIDPRLKFPVSDDIYFNAAPAGDVKWHAEPTAAGNQWAPSQGNAQPPAVAAVDSSPMETHPPSISSTSRHSSGPEPDASSAYDRGKEHPQIGFAMEIREAETTVRDDVDRRYEDAKDIPGEDYDLRKYDLAKDDDEGSEEGSEADSSDAKSQAIDLSEESEEDEEDELHGQASETEQNIEGGHGTESVRHGLGANEDALFSNDEDDSDDEVSASDVLEEENDEAGYYDEDDEDGGDEGSEDDNEEEEEEEEYAGAFSAASKPAAPQEPVFISLLSDSEDDQEPHAQATPPSTLPPSAEDSMALDKPAEGVPSKSVTNAETQQDSESSANSDPDVDEDQPLGQEPTGHAHEQQGLGAEPVPSQPVQSLVLEAAEHGHDSTRETAGVHDSEDEHQSERKEQPPAPDAKNVEFIVSAVADAIPSGPMDVDGESEDEAQSGFVSTKELPGHEASEHEARTSPFKGQNPTSQSDKSEALVKNKHVDAESGEVLLAHQETAMNDLDSQFPELRKNQEERQSLEASDSLMQDPLPNESSEHHLPSLQTAGVDEVPGATEIQEVDGEPSSSDSHLEAPEGSATLEAPKAATPGRGAEQPQTSSETRLEENAAELVDATDKAIEGDEHDLAAQAQIITECQEYCTPAKQNASRSEARDKDLAESAGQEPNVLITVKSLRSRGHGRSGSGDVNRESHQDPSLLLARASSSHPSRTEPSTGPKSPTRLRASGNRGDASDPSLVLAGALVSESAHPKERQSRTTSRANSSAARPSSSPPRGKRRHATPEVTRELRSKPHEAGRRSTPETVAETVLNSPSVAGSVEDEDVAATKRNLQKTLRTALPDFVPLRSLRSSLNKTVDILAVSTSTPPQPHRPKHGPRDYMLELILTDPSTAPTGVVIAHLFRPHQASLPVLKAEDIILLRRVQVVSVKGRGFGARAGEASAWAVFEKDDEEMLPQIKGPPVEVTDGEVEYAQGLKRWWAMQGEGTLAKIDKATQKASQADKSDAR